MRRCVCRRTTALVIASAAIAPFTALAAQPAPHLFGNLDALQGIPAPPPMLIRPREFAAYGALITAATLTTLYLYRGRAFIVYWIGSWLLVAASLALLARGYGDVRLGSVMLGLAQLLAIWSAGLMLLGAAAFPDEPLRWTVPLKVAAATAVWFLAAPLVLPLVVVLATGPAAAAVLLGWAAARYLRLGVRTRYVGVAVIGLGMLLLGGSHAAAAAVSLNVLWDAQAFNQLLGFNIIVNLFVALGMHVLVFEDMTDALRRAHRDLAQAHQEVKRLVITDALTGCHNRRFFEQIERREIQRHRRYGAPLSVVFVDVNHFKRLNDTLGHDVGDEVLKAIGALLRRHVRESDYVIRWGGDEFVLLLTCGLGEAERKADELKRAFERERRGAGLPDGIGLSIGAAPVPADAASLAAPIRQADTRMYDDKLRDSARTRALE
ncbi:MAG: GGDEF domain-containing protein [Acidobacteria bacterium]|nr:GGDEF domain-containing protein [Acidobacteriota bacterium]